MGRWRPLVAVLGGCCGWPWVKHRCVTVSYSRGRQSGWRTRTVCSRLPCLQYMQAFIATQLSHLDSTDIRHLSRKWLTVCFVTI
eukprot:COSAG05_NODE_180_length_14817_cov_423.925262_5_plen_84_part_00